MKLTGTDLFLSWLAEEDEPLYTLFRQTISIETYDKQKSCVLHLFFEGDTFSTEQQAALNRQWREYCNLFNLPVNPDSLQDLATKSLKEIFDRFSGKFAKFILSDGHSFFGRFQQLYYSHSPFDPAPPNCTAYLELLKYPNFYTDENAHSSVTETIIVTKGQLKHVIPICH